jgi:glutaredoxin
LIDVDRAEELKQAHGTRVPVVVVNGRERFHGRVNRALLERLLAAETAQG